MITLNDAMKLQGMLSTHPVLVVTVDIDYKGVLLPVDRQDNKTIRRHWPTSLIRIHANDGYGAKLDRIPTMRSKSNRDYRLIWNLCHALLCVPVMWEHASQSVYKTSQWHGFVLSYLSKTILGQSTQGKQFHGDPFDLPKTDERYTPGGLSRLLQEYCI